MDKLIRHTSFIESRFLRKCGSANPGYLVPTQPQTVLISEQAASRSLLMWGLHLCVELFTADFASRA